MRLSVFAVALSLLLLVSAPVASGDAFPAEPLVQVAHLTGSDVTGQSDLGISVAFSGNTIVVGAPYHQVGSNAFQGAVYVYRRSWFGWHDMTQVAELTASDGAANDHLGYSVAISGDTIVAGAPGSGNSPGKVYIFKRPGWGWTNETQSAELTDTNGPGELGWSVAISDNTIAASALAQQIGSNPDQGAVYVFAEPEGGWQNATQTAELTASDGGMRDFFGGAGNGSGNSTVAISDRTIIVGAPDHNQVHGAVYVFAEPTGGWQNATQTAELAASDGAFGDFLGDSVAIQGDTIVVGEPGYPGENPNGSPIGTTGGGAVDIFTEPPGGWQDATQSAELTASDGTPGWGLGSSVAITPQSVFAGAPGAPGNNFGEVFVFDTPSGGWADATQDDILTTNTPGSADVGWSVAASGDSVVAGALNGEKAYVFSRADQTAATVACTPSTVVAGTPTTCTVTVSDTTRPFLSPAGQVAFTTGTDFGTFSPPNCWLRPTRTAGTAACQTIFVPLLTTKPVPVVATYDGEWPFGAAPLTLTLVQATPPS